MCLLVIVKVVVTVRDPSSDQLGSEQRFLHANNYQHKYWSLTVRTYIKLLDHLQLFVLPENDTCVSNQTFRTPLVCENHLGLMCPNSYSNIASSLALSLQNPNIPHFHFLISPRCSSCLHQVSSNSSSVVFGTGLCW